MKSRIHNIFNLQNASDFRSWKISVVFEYVCLTEKVLLNNDPDFIYICANPNGMTPKQAALKLIHLKGSLRE